MIRQGGTHVRKGREVGAVAAAPDRCNKVRPDEGPKSSESRAVAASEAAFANLTFRQFEVLETIAESVEVNGFPPTIREIGDALDIGSTNGVNDHLKALERKRCITRAEMRGRTLRVTLTGLLALKAWRERIQREPI